MIKLYKRRIKEDHPLVVLFCLGQWHERNEYFLYLYSSETTSTKRM